MKKNDLKQAWAIIGKLYSAPKKQTKNAPKKTGAKEKQWQK